jgi:glucokinase
MLLVGDIGGTNTRLALFSDDAREIVRQDVLPSAAHRSLSEAIDAFLGPTKRPKLRGATFGIAGPVIGGRVKATNLPWLVDEKTVAKKLGLPKVTLINDLVALALGAVAAKKKDLHLLMGKAPRPRATVVVLAAGTGLGEAALVWDGARLVPCGTEGGHTDLAARTNVEWELRNFIADRIGGRVSYERVLSGPGIGMAYDFFREKRGVREGAAAAQRIAEATDRNAAIAELGMKKESEACAEALALFAGGGIASSILPVLEQHFVPAFVDKGRFSHVLREIPVAIVKSSSIGLYGSARHAAGLT